MGDLIELLFALIVGAFWLFGSSIFRNREETESGWPPSSSAKDKTRQSEDVNEERQREIREAIRRKIAERRSQTSSDPVGTPLVIETKPSQSQQSDSQVDIEKPVFHTSSSTTTNNETSRPSVNMSEGKYEQIMQDQLQKIENTMRKADAIKQKVRRTKQNLRQPDKKQSSTKDTIFSGSILTVLRNPQAARKAFIYAEIFGKPASMRNSLENN